MSVKKDSFFKSLLKFAVGPLGAALIGFITVPITTWLVSPEQFGLTTMFTLFQTLITSFIYLGLDQAYGREYNNKIYDKKKLFLNAIIIPLGISIIIALFIVIFRNSISLYIFNEVNFLLMNCLAIWIPFIVVERFLLLDIRMQEKGIQYSLYNILTKIFVMILTISLLLLFDRTYTSIVLGTMLSQIISCTILIILSRNKLKFKPSDLDYSLIRTMLKFGLPILPSVVLLWILNSSDRIVLNHYTTIGEIGIYFSSMKLVTALNMIQSIFATFWLPMAYRWHEEDVNKEQFEKVSYGVGIFMGVIFIGILLFKEVLVMILSPEYYNAQYTIPFLLFSPIMYTMSETTTLGIVFSRKTHFNILTSLIASIVNICINLILVPFIGGVGAAIGTGIAYIIFFWTRTMISRQYWYKFNLKFYVINTISLIIIAIVNILVRNNYIHLFNFIFLVMFILINIPFINTIINLQSIFQMIKLRSDMKMDN